MADIRPKDLLPTADGPADDDYLLLDGATLGTRKMLANSSRDLGRGLVSIFEFITAKADRDAIKARTGTADLTTVFDTATAQIHTAGGGTLFLPAGLYNGTVRLTRAGVTRCNLRGDFGGTVLRAAADGEFALTISNEWADPIVEDVTFDGFGTSGVAQRSGICAARRVNLHNVAFAWCVAGMISTDNYYGHLANVHIYGCDVGLLFGTFSEAQKTITDLQNGDGSPTTAVMPTFAANADGHSGNKVLTNLKVQNCRVGVLLAGGTYSPNMEISKGSIESCQVGLAVLAGNVTTHSIWLEGNGTTGTEIVNGNVLQKASLYAEAISNNLTYERIGVRVIMSGATELFGLLKTGPGAVDLVIHEVSNFRDIDIHPETGLFMDRIYADSRHIAHVVERPMPFLNNPRSIWSYGRHKTSKRYVPPINGDVMISESFEGAALVSSHVTVEGTKTFEVTDGLWPSQKCLQSVVAVDQKIGLAFNGRGPADAKNCTLMLTLKSDKGMTLFMPNFSFNTVVENGNLPIVADKWTTVIVHGRTWGGVPDQDLSVLFKDFTGDATILISALQLLTFDARGTAAEAIAEPFFYVNETVA